MRQKSGSDYGFVMVLISVVNSESLVMHCSIRHRFNKYSLRKKTLFSLLSLSFAIRNTVCNIEKENKGMSYKIIEFLRRDAFEEKK